jgi:hypothetical protein
MSQLSATELAQRLNVTKGRVSQYVAEGKLDGCYQGDGRARRFDLVKVADRLGKVLDKGQMLGNGIDTRRALRAVEAEESKGEGKPAPRTAPKSRDGRLDDRDPDELELLKIAKQSEELRRLRRDNAVADGAYVLAEAAQREMLRLVAQEIAEIETVLRDAARNIADKLGVDFRTARKILVDTWRSHREGRSDVLKSAAADAEMTAAEKSADI